MRCLAERCVPLYIHYRICGLLLAAVIAIGAVTSGAAKAQVQDGVAVGATNRLVGSDRAWVAAPPAAILDQWLRDGRLDEIYDVYWGVTYRYSRSIRGALSERDGAFTTWLRLNTIG